MKEKIYKLQRNSFNYKLKVTKNRLTSTGWGAVIMSDEGDLFELLIVVLTLLPGMLKDCWGLSEPLLWPRGFPNRVRAT